MRKRRAVLSLGIALALVISLVSVAYAADFDLYNRETKAELDLFEWLWDADTAVDVGFNPSNYLIEANEEWYEFEQVNNKFTIDPDIALEDAITDLEPVDFEEPADELEVVSVSAISETVDVKGTLEFAINGKEEAADLKDLKEAGYDVKFLASKDVFADNATTSETGKVDVADGTEFEYQVVVSKDGEEVAKSARQKVKAQVYANTVTEITSVDVVLVKDADADNVTLDSNTLVKDETANLVVKGKVKGSDKEVTITDNVKFSVNRPAVATVDTEGLVTAKVKGTVTVTIKAGDIEETLNLKVENETRKVDADKSSIAVDKVELAAGKSSDKIRVELKDQYGDDFAAIVTAENDEKVEVLGSATAPEVKEDEKTIVGAYDLTLTAGNKTAKGNVVVKAGDVELGKIYVEVKEAGDVADYVLETENTELDIKGKDSNEMPTATLTLKSVDKDGLVVDEDITISTGKFADATDKAFVAESSDEKVATVNGATVTAVATGEATITVYQKVGAFKEERASIKISVVDSTPEITAVNFKSVAKVTETKNIALEDILEVVISGENKAKFVLEDEQVVIKEDVKDGEESVTLGSLDLTSVKDVATFNNVGEEGKEVLSLVVTDQADPVKGKIILAVLDNDGFVDQTIIDVDLPVNEDKAQEEYFDYSSGNTYILGNLYTPSKTERGLAAGFGFVFKKWKVNQLDSLKVILLNNDEEVAIATLKDTSNWTGDKLSGAVYTNATETGSWLMDKTVSGEIGETIYNSYVLEVVKDGVNYTFTYPYPVD